jgi:sarcosine oxidase subunit alpha
MRARRLRDRGSWIDRSTPVRFRFAGGEHEGFEGDTLASALLANGITAPFLSPILGRPRGVCSAGPEEPNAFVAVLEPSLDLIAPATMVPLVDGLVAEPRHGVANLADAGPGPAIPPAEHLHRHVETVVIGAGTSGLAAAVDAARAGDRVLVVDEHPVPGGASGPDGRDDVLAAVAELGANDDAALVPEATALGIYDAGYIVVHERSRPAERIWHVRAGRVVLAAGTHERPIAFAGNDLPGVMLAGAVEALLGRFGVLPGERAVVFTTNDAAYAATAALREAGCEVAALVDVRRDPPAALVPDGTDVIAGGSVVRARGDGAVREVVIRGPDGAERTVEADLLVVSGGFNPVVGLARAIGAGLRFDGELACFVPDGSGPPWLRVVGRAAGEGIPPTQPCWFVDASEEAEAFVDLQRDQTVADVRAALDAGLRSVEHVKRATYIGTAIDQGRLSGVLTAEIVNRLSGADPGAQGPTSARPPAMPVSYAALAGPYRGDLLDPVRRTPIHTWHVANGAVFEDVGQWKRPWFFPRDGEDMEAAVARECLAVRTGVGAMDASTLGKIEVAGPDAPAFLDRMYTNAMSTLGVGRIRYGLMLGLDGMAWDDGVAMRLADDRYLVTTTTGNAAAVLDRFEEWLQTEWPHLRVYCTGVTEQWATVAVAGPRAREVVAALGSDVDLSREAFPFMTFREGDVAGIPARIARVSFSGELAYELNVDARFGLALWEAVMAAGEPFGITPYGTEAMHVLRAEKGYVIVGQDTDGTVTPHDLGMSWIVNETKGDFLGRRSLRRPDTVRPDRKQLVGLLPVERDTLLPEGAQLVLEDTGTIPMRMVGHVTSSYRSPVLGRTFALAMVERGRELHGRTLFAPLPDGTIAAEVTRPVFYDPENLRRDGLEEEVGT